MTSPISCPNLDQLHSMLAGTLAEPGQSGRLAHYEITEVIGRGGMGIVLKAFDSSLHRVVAMKVLQSNNAEARRRFLREARAAAKVTHDNVVTIHDVNEANGVP